MNDSPRAAVPTASAELLALELGSSSRLRLRIGPETFAIALRASGAHNAQNAAGAAALALTFGLEPGLIADGLRAVEPAFGRGQAFTVDGPPSRPAPGQESSWVPAEPASAGRRPSHRPLLSRSTMTTPTAGTCPGYGTSTSRLPLGSGPGERVDQANLPGPPEPSGRPYVITAGTRAADMALRLHYDNIETDAIEADLRTAVHVAVPARGTG